MNKDFYIYKLLGWGLLWTVIALVGLQLQYNYISRRQDIIMKTLDNIKNKSHGKTGRSAMGIKKGSFRFQ
jgi:hypothetical protein